jgi:hypothetical protein
VINPASIDDKKLDPKLCGQALLELSGTPRTISKTARKGYEGRIQAKDKYPTSPPLVATFLSPNSGVEITGRQQFLKASWTMKTL